MRPHLILILTRRDRTVPVGSWPMEFYIEIERMALA